MLTMQDNRNLVLAQGPASVLSVGYGWQMNRELRRRKKKMAKANKKNSELPPPQKFFVYHKDSDCLWSFKDKEDMESKMVGLISDGAEIYEVLGFETVQIFIPAFKSVVAKTHLEISSALEED